MLTFELEVGPDAVSRGLFLYAYRGGIIPLPGLHVFRLGVGEAPEGEDLDGDGFRDADDPSPCDAGDPGDFSSPEKMLEHPLVVAALAQIQEDTDLALSDLVLGTDLPDIAGRFRREVCDGEFIATGNDRTVGTCLCGAEFTWEPQPNLDLEVRGRGFCGPGNEDAELLKSSAVVSFVRGVGDRYTRYETGVSRCPDDFVGLYVAISTGTVDPVTGDLLDVLSLSVTIATLGIEPTPACIAIVAGDTYALGGWDVTHTPRIRRLE